MIGLFLIVEMADAADKGVMVDLSRPIDCFSLCFEGGKYVICVVFDHIIFKAGADQSKLALINVRFWG